VSHHAPEPWTLDESQYIDPTDEAIGVLSIESADSTICCYEGDDEGMIASYRRIVACVNKCRSIPTDYLETLDPQLIAALLAFAMENPMTARHWLARFRETSPDNRDHDTMASKSKSRQIS
jgi:hypothetical protein